MDRKCENCEYCHGLTGQEKAWGQHRSQCRINPPNEVGKWPSVKEDGWCGQFVAKPGHFPGMVVPEMSAKELAGVTEDKPPVSVGTIQKQAKEAFESNVTAEAEAKEQ